MRSCQRDHTVLPATHTFINEGTNHPAFTPANSPHLKPDLTLMQEKKERERIYIAPFIYYVYLKALSHRSGEAEAGAWS